MLTEQSSERLQLEQELENKINTAKRMALVYAIPSLLAAASTLSIENGKKVFSILQRPNKRKWQEALENFRRFDAQDNFRGARAYTDQVIEIASSLPQNLRKKAYYPFAGTDVFWAGAFEKILFEDINYDTQKDKGGLQGSTANYNITSLETLTNQLKNEGVINTQNQAEFLRNSSRVTSKENDRNNLDTVLICKGGCGFRCILPRFHEEGLHFGAIIITNDREGLDPLLDSLNRTYALE